MKKLLSVFLAALMIASVFTGCVPAPEGNDTQEPEIVEPTPPPYTPNPWTGYERTDDFNTEMRATAIMVNNISACRPQRGLSQANILFESMVEGGITRFMAIFEDYTKLDGDVGPVRSGRDQFLQWAMPYEALYCHIGRSEITQTYIDSFEYNYLDIDGRHRNFTYRRNRPGYDLEHTAYTNAELLQTAIDKYEYNMSRSYNSPIFNFVNYNENEGKRELTGQKITDISIVHSETYRTYFTYDETTGKYKIPVKASGKNLYQESTFTSISFLPNSILMISPIFSSFEGLAGLLFTKILSCSAASFASVLLLISLDTFRYLSNLISHTPILYIGKQKPR